ncbi:cobalamin biosynthesis protein CbiB [Thalassotalea insulae]|uniref:Cobalamin biosynthesis protein CbiB n=1 Tax=Thalassotalea insulae TaxID=2056778 RepID=A0ABQ6GRK6_9GAMM|nr:cobalamin biosynthesis protein [Thalassotalea insulae]GLX77974.1 cobalamin biosynthesis protein CbiB [Thalassotalea insulae]
MDFLLQLPATAHNILLLLLVVVVKWLQAQFFPASSVNFLQFYCQQLAAKVNKAQDSTTHQKIAGIIATLITFVPIVLILWIFADFVALPFIWDGLLLYFAFGAFGLNAIAQQEAKYLSEQNKYQAKQTLAPHVLRDTEQMSPLGLTKASIEMLIIKKFQQQFTVGCYFLLLGPLAAFSYRMLLEMHYSWNIKQAKFRAFGQFIHHLVALIQWLPGRLYLLGLILTSIGSATTLYWRLVRQHFFKLDNNIVIGYFAYLLSIQLGGVAMYSKEKLRRISFNQQSRQPEAKHILLAIKQLNLLTTLFMGLLISLLVIITILSGK